MTRDCEVDFWQAVRRWILDLEDLGQRETETFSDKVTGERLDENIEIARRGVVIAPRGRSRIFAEHLYLSEATS